MPAITLIDYGMGNLWSVRSALQYLGYTSAVSSVPAEIECADILILPGVGSYRAAMQALRERGLDQAILEAVAGKKKKLLGICLGMQLMGSNGSEDGETAGLGLIPSRVERFDVTSMKGLKVPHVGFNLVRSEPDSVLFRGIASPADFYFVHSYRLLAAGLSGIHGICQYGQDFLAAYERDNIFATQFHPEKSQTNGLRLLRNFLTC